MPLVSRHLSVKADDDGRPARERAATSRISASPSLHYRPDIDGLRAIAVAAVVVFHAFPSLLRSGFIGVDIFFVISGYLITSIVARRATDGRFSLRDFYSKRIRRIVPALALILAVTYLAGWRLLMPDELQALGRYLTAAAVMGSNIAQFRDTRYFDTASALKPLVHLWSLSVEEQFYLIWPVSILIARRLGLRGWIAPAAGAAASFALNLYVVGHNASAAFYLPHTRIWELLMGALLAMIPAGAGRTALVNNALGASGIAALTIAAIALTPASVFPGWWALLPAAGTTCLIAAGPSAWINRVVLSTKVLVFLGLISYPLYLWHWPLLALGRIAFPASMTSTVSCVVVLVSIGLAWLTYRFVETPMRRDGRTSLKVAALCVGMMCLGVMGLDTVRHLGFEGRAIARVRPMMDPLPAWPYWSTPDCVARYATEPCIWSDARPETILLGDSHANHLYAGLVRAVSSPKIINVGTCWPLEGVRMAIAKNQASWPCTNYDAFAFERRLIEATPTLRTAVISDWWSVVLAGRINTPDFDRQWGGYSLVPERPEDADATGHRAELAFRGLSRTIGYLESRALDVVIVLDTPSIDGDLRAYCASAAQRGRAIDCGVPRAVFEATRVEEMAMVARLRAAHQALTVFDPAPSLCDADRCAFSQGSTWLYRDEHHLSPAGSERVAERLWPVIEERRRE